MSFPQHFRGQWQACQCNVCRRPCQNRQKTTVLSTSELEDTLTQSVYIQVYEHVNTRIFALYQQSYRRKQVHIVKQCIIPSAAVTKQVIIQCHFAAPCSFERSNRLFDRAHVVSECGRYDRGTNSWRNATSVNVFTCTVVIVNEPLARNDRRRSFWEQEERTRDSSILARGNYERTFDLAKMTSGVATSLRHQSRNTIKMQQILVLS